MSINLTASVIACNRCRKLHISCNKQLPSCTECKNKNYDCMYSQPQRRGPTPKAQLILQLEQKIKELSCIIEAHKKHIEKLELEDRGNNNNSNNNNEEKKTKRNELFHNKQLPNQVTDVNSATNSDIEIYLKLYSKFIQPYHLHKNQLFESLPEINENYLVLISSSPTDLASHRVVFNLFTVLATGARLNGNLVHAEYFIHKARTSAKELFDDISFSTGCCFMCIAYYYFIFEESDYTKATHYNSIVLQLCDSLKDGAANQNELQLLKTLALNVKSILCPEKKTSVCGVLQNLETPYSKIISVLTFVEGVIDFTTPQMYNEAFIRITQVEQYLPHCNFNSLIYLQLLITCKALSGSLNLIMENIPLAIKFANEASILFMKLLEMQDFYVLWWQLKQLQRFTGVHIITKFVDMLEFDITILERCTTKPYVPKSVYVILADLRNQRQSITNVTFTLNTNNNNTTTNISSTSNSNTRANSIIDYRLHSSEKQASINSNAF